MKRFSPSLTNFISKEIMKSSQPHFGMDRSTVLGFGLTHTTFTHREC